MIPDIDTILWIVLAGILLESLDPFALSIQQMDCAYVSTKYSILICQYLCTFQ